MLRGKLVRSIFKGLARAKEYPFHLQDIRFLVGLASVKSPSESAPSAKEVYAQCRSDLREALRKQLPNPNTVAEDHSKLFWLARRLEGIARKTIFSGAVPTVYSEVLHQMQTDVLPFANEFLEGPLGGPSPSQPSVSAAELASQLPAKIVCDDCDDFAFVAETRQMARDPSRYHLRLTFIPKAENTEICLLNTHLFFLDAKGGVCLEQVGCLAPEDLKRNTHLLKHGTWPKKTSATKSRFIERKLSVTSCVKGPGAVRGILSYVVSTKVRAKKQKKPEGNTTETTNPSTVSEPPAETPRKELVQLVPKRYAFGLVGLQENAEFDGTNEDAADGVSTSENEENK